MEENAEDVIARRFAFHFALTALLLLGGLSVAHAMPTAVQIGAAFRALDVSQNNAIDAQEWQRGSFVLFRAADKNGNDFIDADELKSSALAQDTFLRIDTDHDGRLSIDEFMAFRRRLFDVADIDHDDYLTFVEYELLMLFETSGWVDANHSARIEASELAASLTKAFAQLDVDGDARLSPSEAAYMQPKRFARFDRDQDGKLTLEETIAGYRAEFGA